MSTLGTVGRGRYTPLNADSTKNPERLLALRGQKGATWFVDSAVSSSGNGLSWGGAFETIAEAITKALAGDLILVAEGHAESTAVAVTMAVAGVHVVGLGVGDRRPVITFTADVDWNLNAAGIVLENLVLKNDSDSQAIVIEVNAADCQVRYCELREGASKQFLVGIDIGGAAANAADGTKIIGCEIYSITAGANSGIKLSEISDVTVIEDCVIDGDFGDAGIHNPTAFILTNLRLQHNIVRNRQTGDHAIELVSACTGFAIDNRLFADTFGTAFDPGALFCAGNTESVAAEAIEAPSPVSSVSYFPLQKYIAIKRSSVFDGATTNAHGDDAGTSDPYILFTVTGDVLIWAIWGVCNTTLTNATATISVGVTGNTAGLIALETATEIVDGNIYVSATQAVGVAPVAQSGAPVALNDGFDINEYVATADVTGGQIDYYCVWSPAEPGASVVAA